MGTLIEEETITVPVDTERGDHDRFAHYFTKDDIVRAHFDGAIITALCGKQDRPLRSPEKYPVCPECKETFASIPKGTE